MKKIFSAFMVMVTALTAVSCNLQDNGSDSSDKNTLTIMGKKSDLEKSYMTSIFEQYEKAFDTELEIISIEDAEYETEAEKRFSEGNVPDIFMHFHNTDLNRFDVDENFYYLNDEKWVSDLTDSSRAYCEDGEGNLIGLPFWESSVSGCYYNKTLLDSLGLKPATTQAEFDVLCQTLYDAGYTPICWPGNGCSWMVQFALDPIFADNPSMLEKVNKNEMKFSDIPEVTNMVQLLSDAAINGWFGSYYLSIGWSDISKTIGSGDAVMVFIWDTWFYTDYEKGNKYSVDDFALMPIFLNTANEGTYEGGNLNMMMVNKNSKKLKTALNFLSFCATEKNYNIAFDGISTVNCFKGQNTNIQSQMVKDASSSIKKYERVSTASTRIVGYSADEMADSLRKMFTKEVDVTGCVNLMDECRISAAKKQGEKQ